MKLGNFIAHCDFKWLQFSWIKQKDTDSEHDLSGVCVWASCAADWSLKCVFFTVTPRDPVRKIYSLALRYLQWDYSGFSRCGSVTVVPLLCFSQAWVRTSLHLSLSCLRCLHVDLHVLNLKVREKKTHRRWMKFCKVLDHLNVSLNSQATSAAGPRAQKSSPTTPAASRQVSWSVSCLSSGGCYLGSDVYHTAFIT